MTDDQILEFYDELVAFYSDRLVNFEYYPRTFAKQVQLYKYYKGIK